MQILPKNGSLLWHPYIFLKCEGTSLTSCTIGAVGLYVSEEAAASILEVYYLIIII